MVKNLLRKAAHSLLGMVFAVNAGCVAHYKEEPREYLRINNSLDTRIFAELNPVLNFSRPIKEVRNVPESLRYYPIHPDDVHKVPESNNGVIEDDSAKPSAFFAFEFFKLGLETRINQWMRVETYVDLAWTPGPTPKEDDNFSFSFDSGEMNERNYLGLKPGSDKRGRDTALTYWTTRFKPDIIPGFKVDLIFPFGALTYGGNTRKNELVVGAGIRKYALKFEGGWDRHDNLERMTRFTLADIEEKSVYIGWRRFFGDSEKFSAIIKWGRNFNKFDNKYPGVNLKEKEESSFVTFGFEYRN
jgi:hypothetical protein